MSLGIYQASVPVFIHMLGNLRTFLVKAAAHAENRKFDATVLADSRLFPDMFPLSRQVQIATDMAKGATARLAGLEPPSYEDSERTLPELIARVDKTIVYIQSISAAQIENSETRAIELKMRTGVLHFDGQSYLLQFVLPNFYFHVTTAYNLLRHNGVELAKMDFLGSIQK